MKKAWLLLLLMSSCVVGPNYRRPCLDIPEEYRFFAKITEDTINTTWWEQFEDPILTMYIDEALRANLDIKIASANVEKALGILIQTRSEFFPQIGYSLTAMKTLQSNDPGLSPATIPLPSPVTIKPISSFEALINGRWELDMWGRITRLVQSAKANLYAAEEFHRGVIQTVVATTANTYLTLLGLDAQLEISIQTSESYGEMVIYFEKQYRYGQVSKINVAQALTQYEQAESAIPQIEIQIAQTENALSVLLGRNPGPIERGRTIYTMQFPAVPEGLPADLLIRRPDIRQAELELIRENALIGAAIAEYFPTFTLTGTYGVASTQLKNLFANTSTTWNVAANAAGPLLTFGAISGQVKQATASTQAAFFNYEKVVLNGLREVEDALIGHTLYAKKLVAQDHLIRAAAEYEYLAMLQYREGYAPYFAVLQAQEQLFPAELSWVQTRVLLFTSLVNIYQAMGGGWIILAECKTE